MRFLQATRLVAGMAVVAVLVSGCSSSGGLFKKVNNYFFGEEEVILPGEREEVIAANQDVDADAELFGVPVVVPAAYTNPNWSQPGGNSNNALQHVSLGTQLQRVWSADAGVGSSSQGRLTASPIVNNGRVFVLDSQATLRAFDASNGNRLWVRELVPDEEESDEGYGGGVASDGDRVYVTTAFGNVMALQASTGELIWGKRLEGLIRAAPTVYNGTVFVTTINNSVYALSTEDGFAFWRYDGLGEAASMLASTSPAVSGDVAVVPYTSGEIIAFSVSGGYPLWGDSVVRTGALSSLAAMNDISGRPVIEGNQVFAVSHSGRMIAVELETGTRLWTKNFSSSQTPWVAGPYIFAIAGNRTLMALTRDEGKVRWSVDLPAGQIWSGPVLAGGRLIAVSSVGEMAQINVQTGELLSRSEVGDALYISPIVAGNTIYLLTDDATLIAMR